VPREDSPIPIHARGRLLSYAITHVNFSPSWAGIIQVNDPTNPDRTAPHRSSCWPIEKPGFRGKRNSITGEELLLGFQFMFLKTLSQCRVLFDRTLGVRF
jgi:hypothetical protein